jgi:hypothetical protein
MAGDLKSYFSPDLVRRLAADISRAHPAFPAGTFIKQASTGLDALELLGRGKHIASVLARHLPQAYPEAIDVLLPGFGRQSDTCLLRSRTSGSAVRSRPAMVQS